MNGQQTALLQTDAGFMGLCAQPGDNEIRLSYQTPGSRLGRYLTLLGVLLFAAGQTVCRRRRKKAAVR